MYTITPILAFKDNYIWAITSAHSQQLVVVDPGDAEPVLEFMQANNLQLNAILLTHHHNDHVGGVAGLLKHANVPVFGPANSEIFTITVAVNAGAEIDLPAVDLNLNVLEIPAHTMDHVAYYNQEILFCGDTLFTGGCGRIFEGTAEQMLNALQKLAQLNPETKVYCGHEYTINNLRFALAVEPNNAAIQTRLQQAEQFRHDGLPTVPSTIGEELATNPFLRSHQPAVIAAVEQHYEQKFATPVEVFAALREWKNNF